MITIFYDIELDKNMVNPTTITDSANVNSINLTLSRLDPDPIQILPQTLVLLLRNVIITLKHLRRK
jgi:hypothetical protein